MKRAPEISPPPPGPGPAKALAFAFAICMRMMHKIAVRVLIAAALVIPAVLCVAQNSSNHQSQPHFAGQAPGKAQEIFQKVEGRISGVDTNNMTLTIKPAGEPRTYKVTSK